MYAVTQKSTEKKVRLKDISLDEEIASDSDGEGYVH